MYHALTQGIRKTKLSPSTKGATADKFIIKKTHKNQCRILRSLWYNKNS